MPAAVNTSHAAEPTRLTRVLRHPTIPLNHQTSETPAPQSHSHIHVRNPEFTCLCPLTGTPDFAALTLKYVPDKKCVELKSLKLYIWSFRNEGAFHEDVTNQILNDLVAALSPVSMTVITDWLVPGGIHTVVKVSHPQ